AVDALPLHGALPITGLDVLTSWARQSAMDASARRSRAPPPTTPSRAGPRSRCIGLTRSSRIAGLFLLIQEADHLFDHVVALDVAERLDQVVVGLRVFDQLSQRSFASADRPADLRDELLYVLQRLFGRADGDRRIPDGELNVRRQLRVVEEARDQGGIVRVFG